MFSMSKFCFFSLFAFLTFAQTDFDLAKFKRASAEIVLSGELTSNAAKTRLDKRVAYIEANMANADAGSQNEAQQALDHAQRLLSAYVQAAATAPDASQAGVTFAAPAEAPTQDPPSRLSVGSVAPSVAQSGVAMTARSGRTHRSAAQTRYKLAAAPDFSDDAVRTAMVGTRSEKFKHLIGRGQHATDAQLNILRRAIEAAVKTLNGFVQRNNTNSALPLYDRIRKLLLALRMLGGDPDVVQSFCAQLENSGDLQQMLLDAEDISSPEREAHVETPQSLFDRIQAWVSNIQRPRLESSNATDMDLGHQPPPPPPPPSGAAGSDGGGGATASAGKRSTNTRPADAASREPSQSRHRSEGGAQDILLNAAPSLAKVFVGGAIFFQQAQKNLGFFRRGLGF